MRVVILIFMVCLCASAQVRLTGQSVLTGQGGTDTGGGGGGGSGTIQITRLYGNCTDCSETDQKTLSPLINNWVDDMTPTTTNGATFDGLSVASHTVKFDFLPVAHDSTGQVTAGTCTYAEGAGECTVGTFDLNPTCTLPTLVTDEGECTQSVSVTDGDVTKIALKFELIPEGYGASVRGCQTTCTLYEVSSNACDSSAGTLRKGLADAKTAGGNYIIYPSSSLGEIFSCDAFILSSPNTTILGWTRQGGVDMRQTGVEINQMDAASDCTSTDNTLVTYLAIDPEQIDITGTNVPLGFENGSSGTDCGDAMDGTAVLANIVSSPLGDDVFTMARGSIKNITVAKNIFRDNDGEGSHGVLSQRDATRVSLYNNMVYEIINRAPQIAGADDATLPSDLAWHWFNNFVFMHHSTINTGVTSSARFKGTKTQDEDNLYICSATCDTTNANGARRIMHRNLVNCSRRIGTTEENICDGAANHNDEHYQEGNIIWSAYRNGPTAAWLPSYSNVAAFSPPSVSTHSQDAYDEGLRTLKVVGPRPLELAIDNKLSDAKTEYDKFTQTERFKDSCDDFTGWDTQGGMSSTADAGAPEGANVCEKTSDTASVMYTGASDDQIYVHFWFKVTGGDPSADKTILSIWDGVTFMGRIISEGTTGDLEFDDDDSAGGEVEIYANPTLGTWYHLRLFYGNQIGADACNGSRGDNDCSSLEAGITDGDVPFPPADGTVDDSHALKDGFYGTLSNTISKIQFEDECDSGGGCTFFYDLPSVSPTWWCSEGGCP